jgi:glycosyltransferase involved in cell wall biosynthesis
MKIAIFDYIVTNTNAIGKCHLGLLASLCGEHEFTVFAVEFENPCPGRIHWVRIPAIKRPLALLYLSFHLLAPIYYLLYRWRTRIKFDLVQMVESNLLFGDITYSHFCHRTFLRYHWRSTGAKGLRGLFRWLDHRLHAIVEPWTYKHVRQIVVPSKGLARELAQEYPFADSKIIVLPNPVDLGRMSCPAEFDTGQFRKRLGFSADDLLLVFVALGHYERKGLPLLLDALSGAGDPRVKLVVVGGTADVVANYRQIVDRSDLGKRIIFVGMQADVRPYLWTADALTLPSYYEVFPLVVLEGAAAGLPLLVTPLNGVEEFIRDGINGFLMSAHDAESCADCLRRLGALSLDARRKMGASARLDVEKYSPNSFARSWGSLYQGGD